MQTNPEAVSERRSMAYWRRIKGVTQQEIADPLGLTRQAVSKWERGIALPNIDQARFVAEVLDVPLEKIEFGPDLRQKAPPKASVRDHVAV